MQMSEEIDLEDQKQITYISLHKWHINIIKKFGFIISNFNYNDNIFTQSSKNKLNCYVQSLYKLMETLKNKKKIVMKTKMMIYYYIVFYIIFN